MKIVEITNQVSVQITNEEAELLKKFKISNSFVKSDLTEHDQLIANQLVNKDLLIRRNQDGQITYKRPTGKTAS